MNRLRWRRMRTALLVALAVPAVWGCAANRGQPAPVPTEAAMAWNGEQALARFYWPYAAMAANVYQSQGLTHAEIAPVVSSPILQGLAERAAEDGRGDTLIGHAESFYRQRVAQLCMHEIAQAGSTSPKNAAKDGAASANCEQSWRLCVLASTEAAWTGETDNKHPACLVTREMCLGGHRGACSSADAAGIMKKEEFPKFDMPIRTTFEANFLGGDQRQKDDEKPLFVFKKPVDDDDCKYRSGQGEPKVPVQLIGDGWQAVPELHKQTHPSAWRLFVPELAIDVWRRQLSARGDGQGKDSFEYAIVFRGTAGGGGLLSNLRGLLFVMQPLFWDHYRQVRRAVGSIFEQIDRLHKVADVLHRRSPEESTELQFTAVGHSLGGGLATYLYLRDPRVTRAVVFNASPVDGSGTVPLKDRQSDFNAATRTTSTGSPAPTAAVYSLFERGEILTAAFPCKTGRMWGAEGGPQVQCDRVDLSNGSVVDQHNMAQLACKLFLLRDSLS